MYRFEKFLFFYCLVSITVFTIAAGIFSPNPLNLLIAGLQFPLVAYFWLRVTSPHDVPLEVWSFRLLTVIIILVGLSIFGYYLFATGSHAYLAEHGKSMQLAEKLSTAERENADFVRTLSTAEQTNTNLLQILSTTSAELSELRVKTGEPASSISAGVTALTFPQVTTLSPSTDLYINSSFTSEKIDSLSPNQEYIYLEKFGDWYNIFISATESGWVNKNQVREGGS